MNPVSEEEGLHSIMNPLLDLLEDYNDKGAIEDQEKEIILFAPFTHLSFLEYYQQLYDAKAWKLGSQGVSRHVSGAHTSEISPVWLRQLGVTDVLVGHSEVRGEYEDLIDNAVKGDNYSSYAINSLFNQQIQNAFNHDLRVTYCIGENENQKDIGATAEVLELQMRLALKGQSLVDLADNLIIAYEPRWAIGGGKPIPTHDEIEQVHTQIRGFAKVAGHPDPEQLRVLYGGSMDPENVRGIMGIQGVNGGLVGSACLDAEKFSRIVNYRSSS